MHDKSCWFVPLFPCDMFPIKTSIMPLNLKEKFYSNVWRLLLIETELEEPGRRQMNFGNTGGNVGQQGINSGNVAVEHQVNGRR